MNQISRLSSSQFASGRKNFLGSFSNWVGACRLLSSNNNCSGDLAIGRPSFRSMILTGSGLISEPLVLILLAVAHMQFNKSWDMLPWSKKFCHAPNSVSSFQYMWGVVCGGAGTSTTDSLPKGNGFESTWVTWARNWYNLITVIYFSSSFLTHTCTFVLDNWPNWMVSVVMMNDSYNWLPGHLCHQ